MKHRRNADCANFLIAAMVLFAAPVATRADPGLNRRVESHSQRLSPGSSGRLYLSASQVAQALRSGTIDRSLTSLIAVPSPLHYGDYVWNDAGIAKGPTWIRVDLRSQLISIFRAGNEIGTAV